MEIVLIEVRELLPHEEVKEKKLRKLIDLVNRRGGMYEPVLVDRKTKTLLDGHHRYNTALQLGLKLIPAIEVDYLEDESIQVESWPGKEEMKITKQTVLSMAKSGNLFPPKTSKHSISIESPKQFFSLEELS
ncbi:MAG: ParB N-terminal domain-containing protein [Candidatus Thermoplasmatota archaeon]|nr:ParB N-terminal domain-containing protein [Candidatus Thermoplasmatota archaeon]MEC8721942.1 ParB N-terminal domain-containing protein [Candidatus Thermoplasmatota archaeon]MEC9118565.1 ParB N-terminal domain-containing protein [Candidatus Thermoplasmatota archaeon]